MDATPAPTDPYFDGATAPAKPGSNETLLFWASFTAIVATAFGFVVRTQIIDDWGHDFGLSKTQRGEIFGVGLWPFAISIVLFSLIIDRIGYGKAMAFAFLCHVSSAVITILTPQISGGDPKKAYWVLYIGTFIVALGNGTVEAVTNPVVATLFSREKTKWLNRLHAGWPGGLVLGGILALAMGNTNWQYKVALIFLPVAAYGVLMLGRKFPVNERVAAGVSYRSMLQQVGFFGALIVLYLIMSEIGRIAGIPWGVQMGLVAVLSIAFGVWVGSLGQPLFVFLLLIMVPLATTELGTDSWIGDLMGPAMQKLGLAGGWVLIYTSTIMLILRFFAGPIVHKLSPLGLLATASLIAACGLLFLSVSTGLTILLAATLYGLGKAFFWPTMLGVAAEQFPKGGALTLNTLGGLGMLAVGVLGAPFQGFIQDTKVDRDLKAKDPVVHEQVIKAPEPSIFGRYQAVDTDKVKALPEAGQAEVTSIQDASKRNVLVVTAIFPCLMLVCYLGLIAYFRSRGGYKPQMIISDKEEALLMTGGATGPAEF